MSREMKYSGIPWIGEIPNGWSTIQAKFYCKSVYAGGTPDSNNMDYWDGDIPWLPSGACQDCVVKEAKKFITQAGFDNSSTKLIPPYTTIMAMTGATCGNVGYITFEACANQSVVAYIKRSNLFSKYLFYALLSAREYILTYQTGGAQAGINVQNCKNFIVPYVPIAEQQKIASFLDGKCAEIDEMIALQEKIVEELKAYKQSVITEAVTKGLNPDVPMKDSGIEWIGEIPEHWTVCRIKNAADLFGRIGFRGYTSDDLNKDGIGAITLSPSNMLPMGMDYSSVTYLSWMKYEESPEIKIRNGDILMVKTGSSYGKVSYVESLPREATINPQILRIVAHSGSKHLAYFLQTPLFLYQVKGGVVGGTIPTISQEKINNFIILMPPLSEREEIAEHLDTKCTEIDNLISIKLSKIDSLKEYKKSIIYEYVTGKKEVEA